MKPDQERVWKNHASEGERALKERRCGDAQMHLEAAIVTAEIYWPKSARLAHSLSQLAWLYTVHGDYPAAAPLYASSVSILERARGRMHPELAPILEDYGIMLRRMRREEEAVKVERRARIIRG